MTDEKEKDAFDLDWDDALSDWEKDVEGSAEAKAKPMPQKPAPKPPAPPARALYQPPDPAEIARLRQQKNLPQEHVSFADDDGSSESTVMANIPSVPRPTAPPPAMREPEEEPRPTHRPAGSEMDLDDLLANLDEETRHYGTEVPKSAPIPKVPAVPPKVPAIPSPLGARPGVPAPPKPRSPLLKPGLPKPPPISKPQVERARDSFGEDLASFEASFSAAKSAPALMVPPAVAGASSSGETDALDAILFGETASPETHNAPTPMPPPPVRPQVPTPAPARVTSLEDLDSELDAALGALGGATSPRAPTRPPAAPAAPAADDAPAVATSASADEDEEASIEVDTDLDDLLGEPAAPRASTPEPASSESVTDSSTETTSEWTARAPAEQAGAGGLDDDLFADVPTADAIPVAAAAPVAAPVAAVPSAPAPGPAPAAPAPRTDRGAQAARRTVRSRKPRREVFPLVGRQPHALQARAELLEIIARAEGASPPARARALLAAAELRLQVGETDAVEGLVTEATQIDPQSVAAVRMARAVAAAKRDVPGVARWLEREAAMLPESERSERSALFAAAADAWARAGDGARASAAASAAYAAQPTLLTSLVALALASEEPATAGAHDVLRDASRSELVRGILTNAGARSVERAAATLGTATLQPLLADPAVALRALAAQTDPEARLATLEALGGALDDEPAEAARALEVIERTALTPDDESTRAAARQLGREGHRQLALAVALEATVRDGSADESTVSERLALQLAGPERAALLARGSLLLSSRGALGDAEALARAAASADASVGAVTAARARLADLDPTKRAQRIESEGALAVAAKLAREPGAIAQEAEIFEQASDVSATADVLRLDVLAGRAADRRGEEVLRVALRRAAREGASTSARAAGLLVAGVLSGDPDAAAEAFAAMPSATTARARVLAAETSVDVAQAWHEEAQQASGEHASRAARESARALVGADVGQAAERLAASRSDDLAAAALFAMLAEREGAPAMRAQALARYAAIDRDPEVRARSLVRAALAALSAGDAEQTRVLLARAAADAPDDPILDLMRWRDATGNGDAVPSDVAERRARVGSGATESALAVHTALVLGAVTPGERAEADGTVTGEARAEAFRRVARLEESRRPVQPAASAEAAAADLAVLRATERASMSLDAETSARLSEVAIAIAEQVSEPSDRAPYLREAYTLSLRGAANDAFESRFVSAAAGVAGDPWLSRRTAGLAARRGMRDLARASGLEVAESLGAPMERASAAMHALAADLVETPAAAAESLEVLRAFHAGAPEHPLLAEEVASLAARAGDQEAAAAALEQAARAALLPQRKARLFVAAADAHEEMGGDPARVVAALEEASKADVTYAQVFERLRTALERSGDKERLSGLVARRLAAGGDGPQAAQLFMAQASLREAANDLEGARAALRSALEHTTVEGSPEQLGALKKLAQLSLADEDYRGAAEALIRLAKLRREVDELRWIFFELANIYDRHIPDVKRAEAAYRRVLKLVPDDAAAMERLAELYRRENMLPQAIEMLDGLLKIEMDPDRVRIHRLGLARIHEQAGDTRRAEQTLETTRRASPTDLETLRALADFYGRQKAQTALVMHLNRAAQDFRQALAADLTDEAAWIGLVEVLNWRGRHDAARAAATAAVALGVVDVEVAKLLDEHGGAPSCHDILRAPEVQDAIAPVALPSGVREALGRLGPYLDKAFAFDPRSHRAEKLPARDPAAAKVLEDVGQWLGTPDLELWVAPSSPRLAVPFAAQPPSILLGREILSAPDVERQFLTARTVAVARAGLSGVLRAPAHELAAMLAYVAQQFDSSYQPIGMDPGLVQEQGRRLAKVAPRKVIEDVGPLVLEMVGSPEYDPAKLPMAVSELGDRVALLATGSMPSALAAIFKLAGLPTEANDVSARVATVRRSPEALSLLQFAISEPCFEARRRSGLLQASQAPGPGR